MRKATVVALVLCLLILVGGYGFVNFIRPYFEKRQLLRTSDAQAISTTIKIGGDNYLGYWFISSLEMKKQLARQGIGVELVDDGGAYADRLQRFDKQELDMMVLPANSYLEHGADHNYPGVFVESISESKGADGIVCFADKVPTGKIQDLNNAKLKVVYTGESPSSFLIQLIIADFDLFNLKASNEWRVEVASSKEAYDRARKKEGNCFVLWEPDLSRALEIPGMKYVWGSDKFAGYIIDTFVVRRDFIDRHRDVVTNFFRTYFRVLGVYASNRNRMVEEMSKSTGLSKETVENMLAKIDWYDLGENAYLQFGLQNSSGAPTKDGLIDTIYECLRVIKEGGKLKNEVDPYFLTNKTIIEELLKGGIESVVAGNARAANTDFSSLDDEGWQKLREIGTMKVEPIEFQLGTNALSDEDKNQVDQVAKMLLHNYPSYRIVVKGHTGPGSEEGENVKLSLERAQVVTQRLIAVHNVDPDRLRAEGVGSKMPPALRPGESPRSLYYRMARVEFVLFEANTL